MRRTGPVFLLLLIFVWPPLMAFLLIWVGLATNCAVDSRCTVAGLDIGGAIATLLDLTWQFPLFGFFPVMWLVVVFVSLIFIHRRFQGCTRPLMGVLSVWYLPIAPSLLGLFCVERLALLGGCEIRDRGANDCLVFGTNMGDVFSTATLIPWFALAVVPVSLVISLGYWILTGLLRPRL